MKKKINKKSDVKKSLDYDNSTDHKFRANISLGKNVNVIEELEAYENEFDHEGHMTYDDIENAFYSIIDQKYPIDEFPNSKLKNIEVFSTEDKTWVPVFAESMKEDIAACKKSKQYYRYLVLPDATYHLTKEAELWMKLKEHGIISDDSEFDFNKMHAILETINKRDCNV